MKHDQFLMQMTEQQTQQRWIQQVAGNNCLKRFTTETLLLLERQRLYEIQREQQINNESIDYKDSEQPRNTV